MTLIHRPSFGSRGHGVAFADFGSKARDTASANPEPAYNAAVDDLIDQENFDGFDAFSHELGVDTILDKYPEGVCAYNGMSGNKDFQGADTENMENDGVITLITPGRGGSGQAMRHLYGGVGGASEIHVGPKNAQLNGIGNLDGSLPEVAGPYNHLWWTGWFRCSVGGDPADNNSSAIKGFMFYDDFASRWEFRPSNLRYGGSRWDGSHGDDGSTRWSAGGGWPENSFSGVDYWQTDDGYPPSWEDHNDGNWHRITFEIHAGSAVAIADRGVRIWLDGAYIFDDVGRVPKLFDMFGQGVGIDWLGDPVQGGLAYPHDVNTEGFSVWGNFVSGSAALGTTQFTMDFDDWTAWIKN